MRRRWCPRRGTEIEWMDDDVVEILIASSFMPGIPSSSESKSDIEDISSSLSAVGPNVDGGRGT